MVLKKGSKGDDVKKLQEYLNISNADGDFGPGTEKILKEWQGNNCLVVDGIAGTETLTTMGIIKEIKVDGIPNINKLYGHVPSVVMEQIADTSDKFKINTPLRLAHFLAQCGHESNGFKAVSENLNYSANGLKSIFGKYFPGDLNESYARQPEKIASRVYASRMGNGDENTKDGWKFRGRGYIQLTGHNNYSLFNKFVDEDVLSNPDLVSSKYALLSAAWFFDNNNLNNISDLGSTEDVVTKVTKRVNGGTIGLEDRIKHFNEYYNLIK